jgi:phospholipase D1/2
LAAVISGLSEFSRQNAGRIPLGEAMERSDGRILVPGQNCWRLARAHRAAFLVDAAGYFATLRAAFLRARRSILIVGWDIDSRTRLVQGQPDDGWPETLGPFLKELSEQRRRLEVYILNWDFAMLYAIDREVLPLYTLGWQTHRNLHFHLDGRHPVGACHHQKIVVIDDTLAFVGGMDLAQARWDTPDHTPGAPERVRSNGTCYAPVHDVQMMVDGPVAAALGTLVRERWEHATGRRIPWSHRPLRDPWPPAVAPDVTEVDVAIARTVPKYDGTPEVAEVRRLYLDSIAAARRTLYFENQYLTSSVIGDALEARLQEPDGPEIVIVSRLTGAGWLEENTMEVLRARLLRRLRAADRHGRLHVYYPDCEGFGKECINVHSKLMIMDDRLLRIGSANLANRSMGLDTECDLAIEAREPRVREAILRFRDRLLAEHLGVRPEQVAEAVAATGSLVLAIESLRGEPHTLKPLRGEVPPEAEARLPPAAVIDPETPIDPDRIMDDLLPVEHRPAARKRLVLAMGLIAAAGALSAAWHWGPLAQWLDRDTLVAGARYLQQAPATPLWVLGAYLAASLTATPITLMILVTGLVFGPVQGFCYALAGALLGAAASFGLGHSLGRDLVRRVAGERLNALSRWLRHRGLLAIIAVRLVPVAPFTVVNLVAGASHIRFRDFLLGTLIGMLPGTTAITLFSDRLTAALAHPDPLNIILLLAALALIAAVAAALHRWLQRREAAEAAEIRDAE